MDLNNILYPILTIGGMGLTFGLSLGYAGKLFYVKENPKILEVLQALPGVNCGGCGFVGCAAFAQGVVNGDAKVTGCTVGGPDVAVVVAEIMGVVAEQVDRKVAYIKCSGDCEKAKTKYEYHGLSDCNAIQQLANNGPKECTFGCLGGGSCSRACEFDAIDTIDGIAIINPDKCTNCGKCVITCPRRLIEIVPVKMKVRVACNSWDKGKAVKDICSVGCIACKLCEKACQFDAIHVNANIAKVDYDKCTMCGDCVKKCPTNAILDNA